MGGWVICGVKFNPAGSFLFLVLFVYHPVASQSSEGPGVANARTMFASSSSGSQQLFNGQEVILYSPIASEHPYFLTGDLIFGKLRYDGYWHNDVALHYDLERQLLITPYYYEGTPMQLVSAFVDGFELEGHRFVNVRQPDSKGLEQSGFYEILYEGNSQVYARHRKIFHEKYRDTEVLREFESITDYLMVRNGSTHKFKSVRELPEILIDRKQEVRAFIRKNRNAGPAAVAAYYDNLNRK